MADGTYRFAGSVFFLGRDKKDSPKAEPVYAVTAKHVLDAIQAKGLDRVFFRINFKTGEAKWVSVPLSGWFSHQTDPSIDVAILKTGLSDELDHLVLPFSLCINEEKMIEHRVGLGDEVFVTGLFRHHHGSRKNIPIVRVGNLACMTEEKVSTRNFGEIDAYLIESRSIGGLSGSPVFLNLGTTRLIDNQVRLATGQIFFLFGLIHGHYDSDASSIDEVESVRTDGLSVEYVNTGMAIVVPFHKIEETIIAYEARAESGNPGVQPTPAGADPAGTNS
ncbi:MAG: hypothetical protein ACO3IW_12230 [Burkholderiales bacterium]